MGFFFFSSFTLFLVKRSDYVTNWYCVKWPFITTFKSLFYYKWDPDPDKVHKHLSVSAKVESSFFLLIPGVPSSCFELWSWHPWNYDTLLSLFIHRVRQLLVQTSHFPLSYFISYLRKCCMKINVCMGSPSYMRLLGFFQIL